IFADRSLTNFGYLLVEEFLDAAVALEVGGDKLGGFALIDGKLLREAKRRKSVNHAKIYNFGDAPVFARLLERKHAKHLLRRAGVNVFAAREWLEKNAISERVGEDAQFDWE